MRCTNRKSGRSRSRRELERRAAGRFIALLISLVVILGAAVYILFIRDGEITLIHPYDKTDAVFGVSKVNMEDNVGVSFASDLAVASTDVPMEDIDITAASGAIFDEAEQEVMYGKGLHEKRYPASLTKVMTTLVALKYGNLDDVVTVGPECKDIEMGSSVCEIQIGDQLTLRQLIYGLMINSGNDAAMTIAVHVGGSVEGFVELMNQEAKAIGATNTHFTNTHGLQDENHYTTAYDVYIMFHEALKYDVFEEVIARHTYYAEFRNVEGEDRGIMWESTNHYFINEATPPADVLVYGGKTGTTSEAGACLCLYSKDKYGDPFITVIMKSETRDSLYQDMNKLLSKINK